MKHIFIRDEYIENLFEDKKHELRKRDNVKYSDEKIIQILLGGKIGK